MAGLREVVIIGGGPAGALCGERLGGAGSGIAVTIVDEHLAWEKPCGGGLTHKALRAYPFLLDGPYPKKIVRKIELRSGTRATARLTLREPIVIYSRCVLNGLLLDRAERAGCRVLRARATALDLPPAARPRVALSGGQFLESDFVVLAAGARNRLLPEPLASRPLAPADLEQTFGYYIPVESEILKIKFLPGFCGYLWCFPREGHLSVGICGKLDRYPTSMLREELEKYVDEEGLSRRGATVFSHLLPSPRASTLRERPIHGPGWALAGDAAATVDPITGEGIYYALRSGELLGEALAAGRPGDYPKRVRAEFAGELERAAGLAPRFYSESFLGGPIPTRTVEFARRSPTFRRLLAAIFTGAQAYRTLPLRLWAQLPVSLAEIAWSFLAG